MSVVAGHFWKPNFAAVAVCAALAVFVVIGSGVAPARAATPLAGAATCRDIDRSVQPSGTPRYILSRIAVERAVLCLVNAERVAAHLQPLTRYLHLRNGPQGLDGAAAEQALEAVARPWWGTHDEQGNERNAHINPYTGSTPATRIAAAGYCSSPNVLVGENVYTGWGGGFTTARAAVTWWIQSKPHRAMILNPQMKDTGIAVVYGSANPAAGSITPAATFVQTFGTCNR
jgi:uncharacterized protein YkwD